MQQNESSICPSVIPFKVSVTCLESGSIFPGASVPKESRDGGFLLE